ncbi:transposase [Candidatus Poriferisodalis sp.]|uniref:transposase n=1 Tax=Candidatus Poriferisodalis sp. TaxID=3101277 RepID=UPI003B527189
MAEPTLGPVQALEAYDPAVAEIEAVLEHRRTLVAARTLMPPPRRRPDHPSSPPRYATSSPPTARSRVGRLRLETIDPDTATTPAGRHRLAWLQAFIDQDRTARREIRRLERLIDELLDQHGTTLRDEPGIGPIAAATLLCEVGDPTRFDREAKFARWCGTGAVALAA